MNTPRHPVLIGLSLSPTWIVAMERATDILRTHYPRMPDAEILERLMISGILAIINSEPQEDEAPFGQVGQQVVAVIA